MVIASAAVGVAVHRVDGSSIPEEEMRYAIRRRVCRKSSTSWEYESHQSVVSSLSSAIETRVNILQLSPFCCSGE